MRHLSFTLDWQTYYLLMFAVLAFTLWAQFGVQSAFKKYNQVSNARHLTGADAARRILDANGLYHVQIEHISGRLSDHYDPRANVIRLSDAVFRHQALPPLVWQHMRRGTRYNMQQDMHPSNCAPPFCR